VLAGAAHLRPLEKPALSGAADRVSGAERDDERTDHELQRCD
jgi:hypothetical protein